jgi:hypothetical protein
VERKDASRSRGIEIGGKRRRVTMGKMLVPIHCLLGGTTEVIYCHTDLLLSILLTYLPTNKVITRTLIITKKSN